MRAHYLLDTSAMGIHLLNDRGGEFVADCLRKGAVACVLSRFELAMFLHRQRVEPKDIDRYWRVYRTVLSRICPVDEPVAEAAVTLRRNATARLPMADACIAACASVLGVPLVHADEHFNVVSDQVTMIDLRDKGMTE